MNHSREPTREELRALWAKLDEAEVRKAEEEGGAKERAQVVAWLRERFEEHGSFAYKHAADHIEAGEHRLS
jgi:hypothetical protein